MLPLFLPRALRALCLLALFATLSVGIVAHAEPAAQPVAQPATHQIFLPLVVKGGTTPPSNGSTSQQLIARALQAGTLDRETALRYYLLADFNDPRLPAPYRGASSAQLASAYDQALRAHAALTPATQALVREFSVPPSAPGSWEEQQASVGVASLAAEPAATSRWDTTCKTSSTIKVWYHPANQGDAEQARRICELVDGTIWPKLTGLMGRKPLSDASATHNGGDARFDIYLVSSSSGVLSANSYDSAVSLDKLCRNTPTFMLVNRVAFTRSQLAELLMRAILRGYDTDMCGEYGWLFSATSAWAVDYVYRADNAEHVYAQDYLRAATTPLNYKQEELKIPLPGSELLRFEQGTMLWPYYLRTILSRAELIPAMWNRSSAPNSLEMINGVLPGGWAKQWPSFARVAWNRNIVNDYQKFDDLPHGLTPLRDEPVTLGGAPAKSIALDGAVKYLAMHSYRFTFPDANVRSFAVANRYGEADLKTARVQALIKIGGVWTTEDWTATPLRAFCRDLKAERLEELVLIISNHEFQNRSHTLRGEDGPLLGFTNLGCRGWKVEVEQKNTLRGTHRGADETVQTTAIFERHREPYGAWVNEYYRVREGTATWEHSGWAHSCVGSGSGSYQVGGEPPEDFNNTVHLFQYGIDYVGNRFEPIQGRRYLTLGATKTGALLTVTYVCPDFSEERGLLDFRWLLSGYNGFTHAASDDGTKLTGTFSEVNTDDTGHVITHTWRWAMTALPPE